MEKGGPLSGEIGWETIETEASMQADIINEDNQHNKENTLAETQPEEESKREIKKGVEDFVDYLTEKYPQISKDGKLNYYLAGSIALTLLANNRRFEVLDETKLPKISLKEEKEIPPEAAKELENFVRQVGDMDFVPMSHWSDEVPYEKRLAKGGNGPAMSELSESARNIFKRHDISSRVMCDPVSEVSCPRAARLKNKDRDVYIAEPKMMLAYKAIHIGQTFENSDKTDKFVGDFNAMLNAVEEMYPRKELVKLSHDLAMSYNPKNPNDSYIPYRNPAFGGQMKEFFEEMIATDDNAEYLKKLDYGKERSLGILKILHRFEDPKEKELVIDFINSHRGSIDKWRLNEGSQKNREMIAGYLLENSDLIKKYKDKIHGEPDVKTVAQMLRENTGILRDYGKKMPRKEALEMMPENAEALDILMLVDKNTMSEDLKKIGELLDADTHAWNICQILRADYTKDPARRKNILESVVKAKSILDEKTFKSFVTSLWMALKDKDRLDDATGELVDIKEEDRPQNIRTVFEEYGINYEKQ